MIKRALLILWISEVLAVVLSEVYYVQPTEPHGSGADCSINDSSCPTNQKCHTMDYYASNSHTFFPPADNASIMLYFMCGVHNLTKKLFICNISTLSVVGTESGASVIINMPLRIVSYFHEDNFFTFVNIKKITIENLIINIPSISFVGVNCHLMIKKLKFTWL